MPRRSVELARPVKKLRDVSQPVLRCAHCQLRGQCLPSGLSPRELGEMGQAPPGHRSVRRGEALYQAGDAFRSIYAVRLGFFKSFVVTEDGRSQVMSFQMPCDILGLDGIDSMAHTQSVVALEDSDVCIFPYAQLETAASRLQSLQHQVHRVMGREIVREQAMMTLLGAGRADERVAMFLLKLSERYERLGYSGREFNLRMTREEIGSYLGLQLETVSRTLTRFQERGLIRTRNRYVRILDKRGLAGLAESPRGLIGATSRYHPGTSQF